MDRKSYFLKYFKDEDQALWAFNLMRSNASLFYMGLTPSMCWITCTCLKLHMEKWEGSCPDLPNYHIALPMFPLQPLHTGTWQLSQSVPPTSNEGPVSPGCWGHNDTDICVWWRRPQETWVKGVWSPSFPGQEYSPEWQKLWGLLFLYPPQSPALSCHYVLCSGDWGAEKQRQPPVGHWWCAETAIQGRKTKVGYFFFSLSNEKKEPRGWDCQMSIEIKRDLLKCKQSTVQWA